jgi:hypothetical protein
MQDTENMRIRHMNTAETHYNTIIKTVRQSRYKFDIFILSKKTHLSLSFF